MARRKQLLSIDEAKPAKTQHRKPCSDCPWARTALKGWLGGVSADQWIAEAHGDGVIACHTREGMQCAGAATYRANVCKSPRDEAALELPQDEERVFASPMQFKAHHEGDAHAH